MNDTIIPRIEKCKPLYFAGLNNKYFIFFQNCEGSEKLKVFYLFSFQRNKELVVEYYLSTYIGQIFFDVKRIDWKIIDIDLFRTYQYIWETNLKQVC